MAGVKAVLNLHATSSQRAQLTTAGDYLDRYYDWLENMPNHGYYDNQPVQSNKPFKLRLYDVRVGMEIGYSFYTSSPIIRVGAFAEYGVLQWTDNKNATAPRTQADYTHYMSVDMTHVYDSDEGVNAKPHMIVCGLKLTILFPVGGTYDSHSSLPCRCMPEN